MSRPQQSFNKREVQNKKEKKRKEKEQKRLARKENEKSSGLDDMIAWVDENGMIVSSPPDPNEKTEINLEDIEVSVPKSDPREKPDPIRNGTVTFFNSSKGYGFIRDLQSNESIFVHSSNLIDEIREGDRVIFEIEIGPKGPAAFRVKQLENLNSDLS